MAAVSLQSSVSSTSSGSQSLLKYGWMDIFPVPVQFTLSGSLNTFLTYDLSSIIGNSPNLEFVIIGLTSGGAGATPTNMAVRAVGSSEIRYTNSQSRPGSRSHFFVKVNSSAQIQVLRGTTSDQAWVIGYGYSDVATIFQDAIEITPTTRGSTVTVDLSANVPAGATGVILYAPVGYSGKFGARGTGSSQPNSIFTVADGILNASTLVSSISSARTIELYVAAGTRNVFLRGYFKEGVKVPFDANPKNPIALNAASYATLAWTDPVGTPRSFFLQGVTLNAQAWQIKGVGNSFTSQIQTTAYDCIAVKTGTGFAVEGIGPLDYQVYARAYGFTNLPLYNLVTSTSTVTGAMRVNYRIASAVTSTGTVTGTLKKSFRLGSSVTSTSTVTGVLQKFKTLQSAVTNTSTVTGALKMAYRLISAVASASTVTGLLRVNKRIQSVVTSTSTVAGALSGLKSMVVAITSITTVTGSLSRSFRLTSSVTSSSTVTGSLRLATSLQSTVTSTSTVTALVRVAKGLSSSVTLTSTATASLLVMVKLSSTVTSTTTVTANLRRTPRGLRSTVTSTSSVTVTVKIHRRISSAVVSVSTVVGALMISDLEGSIVSITTVTGHLRLQMVLNSDIFLQGDTEVLYQQNFDMYQGEKRDLRFRVTASGIPINLDDPAMVVEWKAQRSFVDPGPVIAKSSATGGIDKVPGTNIIVVALASADTQALEGYYWHEARLVKVGDIETLAVGRMNLKASTI